jgi:para-nitrobenzyl esterase
MIEPTSYTKGTASMRLIVAILATLTAISVARGDSGPIVTVTGGQIRGATLRQGGAVFKGIPYAQPPIGDLRWREPMPLKPWHGLRDAAEFGAICAQGPRLIRNQARSSENCLFLNVWTPDWPSKSRKPVMVWIPGGGNFGGGSSGSFFNYDGEPLARHGVVIVTLNYRVAEFGFFSHPALTRESAHHASGNQGILDQIAALRWVRDNIAKFGGDPSKVTIFGESSGSLDVSVLMTSPLSKGLFQRVIGESGAVVLAGDPSDRNTSMPVTLKQAEERGEKFAATWKLPPAASTHELRAVSAHDILAAEPNYFAAAAPNLGITVDGYVFPKAPAVVFAAGQEHRVPLLLGNNAREESPSGSRPKDLTKGIQDAYGPLAKQAQALYTGMADPLYGTPDDQWATDTSFRCASVEQLLWHSAAGNPAFEYEFARVPVGRQSVGATHASELSYVFDTLDRGIVVLGGPPAGEPTAVDKQISDAMQQYWTNLAKTGDPNGSTLPKWPKFDGSTRAYLQFTDGGLVAKEGLRRPFCDLFIEHVKRLMAN